jgi:hypothetical protein
MLEQYIRSVEFVYEKLIVKIIEVKRIELKTNHKIKWGEIKKRIVSVGNQPGLNVLAPARYQ